MDFLSVIGFLGLLGLIVLLIIYILKPNYQQRFVSSTHVWKMSLKYRKKQLPFSKFRNILIIICQVLMVVLSAFMLAQPYISGLASESQVEKIIVIDASASMLSVQKDGRTRFERAVSEVKELSKETLDAGGLVTVIIAASEAYYLSDSETEYVAKRQGAEAADLLYAALDNISCTFGRADVDGAMLLANEGLLDNPMAEVRLYTATEYVDYGQVVIVDVSDTDSLGSKTEWNAAVLDVAVVVENNWLLFSVRVACYGQDKDLTVYIEIYGANDERIFVKSEMLAHCRDNQPEEIIFDFRVYTVVDDERKVESGITSYETIHVYILENDSFGYDNNFYLYGGTKEAVRVLYLSSLPNSFFQAALFSVQSVLKSRWDIQLTFAKSDDPPPLTGYEFYIIEGEDMPEMLPVDGVVLLVNPDVEPLNSGISLGEYFTSDTQVDHPLRANGSHPIMEGVNPSNILVNAGRVIGRYDEDYLPLMLLDNDPVFLLKNEVDRKIMVLSFSLRFSDLAVIKEFPTLIINMFNYFFPPTITKYVYDVGEAVSLNARGPVLTVISPITL